MDLEKIVVMAVAAVAEEMGTAPKHVIVRSFKEIHKSDLEQYIAEHHIKYHKYQLKGVRK